MWTDQALVEELARMKSMERELRAAITQENLAERDQVLIVLRLAVPVRRALETWIGLRALRAQLHQTMVK